MIIDPDWAQCKLAMYMDAAGGLVDEKGHTVTSTGYTAISTAQSKFGGASGLFSSPRANGSLGGLLVPSSAELVIGTQDFTFECWFYTGNAGGNIYYRELFSLGNQYANNTVFQLELAQYDTANIKLIFSNSTNPRLVHNALMPLNAWNHVAVTRASGVTRIFVNGVVHTSTYTDTNNYLTPAGNIGICRHPDNAAYSVYDFDGYIDDLYFYVGKAKYITTFTPPTEARGVKDRKVSGTVKDAYDSPLVRTVRAFSRANGSLAGEAVSSAVDGTYEIQMLERGEVTVVMLDDSAGSLENDEVIRTIPVPI